MSYMNIPLQDGTTIKRKIKFTIRNLSTEEEIPCISAQHVSHQISLHYPDNVLSEFDVYNLCSELEHRPKLRLSRRLENCNFEIIKLSTKKQQKAD